MRVPTIVAILFIIVATAAFLIVRSLVIQGAMEEQIKKLEVAVDNTSLMLLKEIERSLVEQTYPDMDGLSRQIRSELLVQGMEFYLINSEGIAVISTIADMTGKPAPVGDFKPTSERGIAELDMLDISTMQPVRRLAAYIHLDQYDVTCLVYTIPATLTLGIARNSLFISILIFDFLIIMALLVFLKINFNTAEKPNPYEIAIEATKVNEIQQDVTEIQQDVTEAKEGIDDAEVSDYDYDTDSYVNSYSSNAEEVRKAIYK